MTNFSRATSAGRPATRPRVTALAVLGVLAVYGWMVFGHVWQPRVSPAADQPYNLQARGLLAGQLHLPMPVPPEFTALADPYDPQQNARFRSGDVGLKLHDLSYYDGKLYLYFGITPALVVFLPWQGLTGAHFPQELAVLLFCGVGYLIAAWLYGRLAEKFFPAASPGARAAGLLALGFASGIPPLLWRPEVYEVAIACAFAFVMAALALVWRALDSSRRPVACVVGASIAYGLAVGARPTVLFGAVILLAPAARAWAAGPSPGRLKRVATLGVAAIAPMIMAGVGLMALNAARFGSPFEFGITYQLAGVNVSKSEHLFSPSFLFYNFRVWFLEPVHWTAQSLFPIGTNLPSPPTGHLGLENPYGVLTSVPFVWFAAVLAFRGKAQPQLRWMTAVLLVLALTGAATVCTFVGAATRYMADFLPALILLAGLGWLALEARSVTGWRRTLARTGAGLVLGYSVAVGMLIGVSARSVYVPMRDRQMYVLLEKGHRDEALAWFETAVKRYPDRLGGYVNLGLVYLDVRRPGDAIMPFERAVRMNPESDHNHNLLGLALRQSGRPREAETQFKRALALNPGNGLAAQQLAQLGAASAGGAPR